MYYKYLVPCFLIGMLGYSCSQEKPDYDVEPIGCISDIVVNTELSDAVEVVQLLVDGTAQFVNLSQGLVSNEWIFPEGVVQTLDGEAVTSVFSNEIEVKFITVGEYSVIARQTFEEPLVYIGDAIVESNIYEKVIDVTVNERMEVSFTAKLLNTTDEFVIAENAANEVESGSIVTFTVTSTQNPTTNKFILTYDDGYSAEADASYSAGVYQANATISKVGLVDVKLVSENSLESNFIEIKGLIQGMPASEPFVAESYSIVSDKMISIILSGEVDPESLEAAQSSFICNVTNSNGFNQNYACLLGLNQYSNKELQLTFSDSIYGDDVVTLNYSASGSNALKTYDSRELDAITDIILQITPEIITINPLWSFEVTDNTSYWGQGWQNGFAHSFVADPTNAENTVLKIDMQTEVNGIGGKDTTDPQAKIMSNTDVMQGSFVEGELYTFSYDLYIPAYGSGSRIAIQLADTPNSWMGDNIIFNDYYLDLSGCPAGEWFTINRTQILTSSQALPDALGGSFIVQAWPDTITDCIYIDNITVTRTTARP